MNDVFYSKLLIDVFQIWFSCFFVTAAIYLSLGSWRPFYTLLAAWLKACHSCSFFAVGASQLQNLICQCVNGFSMKNEMGKSIYLVISKYGALIWTSLDLICLHISHSLLQQKHFFIERASLSHLLVLTSRFFLPNVGICNRYCSMQLRPLQHTTFILCTI